MGFLQTRISSNPPSIMLEAQPPAELLLKFKARESKLQVLPAVAVHAMNLAKNPDCPISDFASVVELDMKLAADILKIANSAAYNPTIPIKSLKQAVLRLGLAGCQSLIITSSYASLLKRLSAEQERICTVLWKHSYDTALLCKYLNEVFLLGFEGEEFACGLIHDFGRVLLAIVDPQRFTQTDELDFDESADQILDEKEAWGIDHCRFGAWYALRQNLPDPIPEVILRHHSPESSKNEECLSSLVATADHMANHLQRFRTPLTYDPMNNPFVSILARHGDGGLKQKFNECARALMKRAMLEVEVVKTIFTDINTQRVLI